jgi:hypothetical protein
MLLLVLGLVLTGCGGNDDPPSSDRATEAASRVTEVPANDAGVESATPAPTIGQIVWATEIEPGSNRPVDRVAQYSSDTPTIFALLPVTGLAIGTPIRASWTYNETALDTLASTTTVEVASDDMLWIEFHLSRDPEQPWPDGTYAVSIEVGGTERREAAVEVVATD